MRHRYTLTFDCEADEYGRMPTVDQLRQGVEDTLPDEWWSPDRFTDGTMADFKLLSIGAIQTFEVLDA